MNPRTWLREKLIRRLDVPSIPNALARARANGLQPGRIFDVGAYQGDFARLARSLWPRAELVCFEPLDEPRARLQQWAAAQADIRISDCLLGAATQSAVVFHAAETASSVLAEHINTSLPTILRDMWCLDEWVQQQALPPLPSLLKLDVQGYELNVLKGAETTLQHVDAVLAEVNLLDIHAGAPLLAELVVWLQAHGLVAYDLCGQTRRPLDRALWQVDMLFVRENSPLRSDKRWGG